MIRASNKVSLTADKIIFNNGFVIAPIVEINGIILRADHPLTQEQLLIKNFLINQNAQVSRVRINYQNHSLPHTSSNYEYYVRIHGTFSISKQDTKAFFDANSDLMANQLNGLDKITQAPQMHSCIEAQYNLCQEKVTYANLIHNNVWEIPVSGMFVGNEANLSSSTMHTGKPMTGKNLLQISTNELISNGRIFHVEEQETNAGLMVPFFSLKTVNIQFSRSANFNDALISGETVNLQQKNSDSVANNSIERLAAITENSQKILTLAINSKIDWLNNPYHEFSSMFPVKSGVEMYELRTECNHDGVQHATVVQSKPRPM